MCVKAAVILCMCVFEAHADHLHQHAPQRCAEQQPLEHGDEGLQQDWLVPLVHVPAEQRQQMAGVQTRLSYGGGWLLL